MTRTLFELTWHQELESVFGLRRSQDDGDGRPESPVFSAVHEPLRGTSISAMTEELRLIAQLQLDEKIKAEKRVARKEKVRKWQQKKKWVIPYTSFVIDCAYRDRISPRLSGILRGSV